MKKDITLVVLAGGMGSRFGGLKQIEPMGPNGEFIIDYSIYDAVKAGFNKVIFVIKEENYEVFKTTIGKRVEPHVKVEYCFQKNDNIDDKYKNFKHRKKPLGTAHAMICCEDIVNENFAIINADDFYGRDAYVKAYQFLSTEHSGDKENYGLIAYLVKNTITENGSVKRGVCEVEDNKLLKLTESKVERVNDKIIATPLDGEAPFVVSENTPVSMNMLLFNPSIFEYLNKEFPKFLEENKNDYESSEYLIPNALFDSIKDNFSTVDVIKTTAEWHGVTYREDADDVKKAIRDLIARGEYNNNLWN